MKLALLILLVLPVFLAADSMVPPSWTYSAEQLAVINQYGPPHHFTLILLQGNTRYEAWFYFGTISRQFGFSNGKKTREVPLGFLINARVTAVTPKQFTFNTSRANLGGQFGPPETIIPGLVPGETQENLSYSAKGLSVTMRNGKIVAVATFPPTQ